MAQPLSQVQQHDLLPNSSSALSSNNKSRINHTNNTELGPPQPPSLETDPFIVVRALYPYQSQDPAAAAAALSFEKDDLIQVVAQLESGWWYGFCREHRGWFPSNFVEEITQADIDLEDEDDASDNNNNNNLNQQEDDEDDEDDDINHPQQQRQQQDQQSPRQQASDSDSSSSDADIDTIKDDLWLPQTTNDGQLYYFNTRTGDSSWTIPTPVSSSSASASATHGPANGIVAQR
ncbi:Rho guanine nucleotide exchange factor 6 [Gryganskiella cystojenkinii]|nr:Rho guanine nucleotide exchange factor 6 [Gryganskiella cystojenkinii]